MNKNETCYHYNKIIRYMHAKVEKEIFNTVMAMQRHQIHE